MTIPFAVFPLIFAVAAFYPFWRASRARAMLQRWARDGRFQIVAREWRCWRFGPFRSAIVGHHSVYRVIVQDPFGAHRACWVKLGSFHWGLWGDEVEISWEREPLLRVAL